MYENHQYSRGGDNASVVPLESVELNTIIGGDGDTVSVLAFPNNNNAVVGSSANVGEENNCQDNQDDDEQQGRAQDAAAGLDPETTNTTGTDNNNGHGHVVVPHTTTAATENAQGLDGNDTSAAATTAYFSVTMRIPYATVPLWLVLNCVVALTAVGWSNFVQDQCDDFLYGSGEQDNALRYNFTTVHVPHCCLPPGWHLDYVQEYPPRKVKRHNGNNDQSEDYDYYYDDAVRHLQEDAGDYMFRLATFSMAILLSSIVALLSAAYFLHKVGTRERSCRYCCPCFVLRAVGLWCRVAVALVLTFWCTIVSLLHLPTILLFGRWWWFVGGMVFVSAELVQVHVYSQYIRRQKQLYSEQLLLEHIEQEDTADAAIRLQEPLLTTTTTASSHLRQGEV